MATGAALATAPALPAVARSTQPKPNIVWIVVHDVYAPLIGCYGNKLVQTPAIDSVWWRQPGDLDINVTTHDPTNNTHYYRYDYIQTWQHDAELQSVWTVINGMITATDSSDQTFELGYGPRPSRGYRLNSR